MLLCVASLAVAESLADAGRIGSRLANIGKVNINKLKDNASKVKENINKVKESINKVKANINQAKISVRVPKYVRPLAKATGVPVSKASVASSYSCKRHE